MLAITQAILMPHVTLPVVLVDATGVRGGRQEWTVHLDRRGKIVSACRVRPDERFHAAADIPDEIKRAAAASWEGATS